MLPLAFRNIGLERIQSAVREEGISWYSEAFWILAAISALLYSANRAEHSLW